MGHIIHPTLHRLGYSRFWNSTWALSRASSNLTYSHFGIHSFYVNLLVERIINLLSVGLFTKNWMLMGYRLIYLWNRIVLVFNLQIHDYLDKLRSMLQTFLQARLRRFKMFRSKRLLKRLPAPVNKKIIAKKMPITLKVIKSRPLSSENIKSLKVVGWRKYLLFKSPMLLSTDGLFKRIRPNSSIKKSFVKKAYCINELLRISLRFRLACSWRPFINSIFARLAGSAIPCDTLFAFETVASLTAPFFARFIATKLVHNFPVRSVFYSVLTELKRFQRQQLIYGFKLSCSGRFARRGRANHIWKSLGHLPQTDAHADVSYAASFPVLINSIASVRVWITRSRSTQGLFLV